METRFNSTISQCTKSCLLIGSIDTYLPFCTPVSRLLLTLKVQHRPGVLSWRPVCLGQRLPNHRQLGQSPGQRLGQPCDCIAR
jgi:hypothetical protein